MVGVVWLFPAAVSGTLNRTGELVPLSGIAAFPSLLSSLGGTGVACGLIAFPDRLVKLLVMLATLSFRIMELAEERTRCSLRARPVIPG